MTQVAILIPGIMGSELRLGKKVIWPGSPLELAMPYKKMEDLMKDNLVAKDVIRKVSFSVQYDSLIEDLEKCGFREKSDPPNLYVFPYDWRQSNVKTADKLANKVDEAFEEHHGQTEISLIAHSMGGLISRFYLESGLYNNRKGFTAISQLLTLGTPHRGAPLALTAALGKERRLFLNREQVRRLVSDPRFPSLYELLPPEGEPFAWDEGPRAAYKPLSIYEPSVASSLRLVSENLSTAQVFHGHLNLSRRPEGVRYFFFFGSRQVTASSVYLFSSSSGYEVRKEEPEDAGDGTVPIWSATLTGVQGRPVGGEHGTIYQNNSLRRTLAALMGSPGMLAAVIPDVEVSVRDKVVEPAERIHVALSFSREVRQVRGDLNFEKVEVDKRGKETAANLYGPPQRMQYSGVAADKIGVVLVAPELPGFYRLQFKLLGRAAAQGSDDLFVQEPVRKEKGREIAKLQAPGKRNDRGPRG